MTQVFSEVKIDLIGSVLITYIYYNYGYYIS